MPDSVTQILNSGPPGTKLNIAVLGDGFAAGEQDLYNQIVANYLLEGVFGHDYFYEDIQAFNIYRVNLISTDSGVGQRRYDERGTPDDGSDDTITSTTLKNTALGYIYSGSWAHCWLENGANTSALVNNALNAWVPDYHFVVIILNELGWGGCGGGGFQVVTRAGDWTVLAHEFGHGAGGLADEYCTTRVWTSGEPGSIDLTIDTNRSTTKWGNFIAPTTPLPTGTGSCAGYTHGAPPAGWDDNQDVGLFEGGGTCGTGVYRPVINCRMRGNSPPYCPVCYTQMKRTMDARSGHTFLKSYRGDFNGDGRDDLLVHNGNGVQLFRSNGSTLDLVFSCVDRVPGSWQFQPGDQFFVQDFNGDGKDEIVVFNGSDWAMPYLGLLVDDGHDGLRLLARYDGSLPGWQLNHNDQFYVGDFNGDHRADLFVFNGKDWAIPYLGMLSSSGTGFNVTHRYDHVLPGWQMTAGDRFFPGDFNGDGKTDLYVFNGSNWAFPYLGMLASNGSSLAMVTRYDRVLPDWQMTAGDEFFVADFDADHKDDLYVFNGSNWAMAYLGMLRSKGSELGMTVRYDGNAPGWQMRAHDKHFVADIAGTGKQGLFVSNCLDWGYRYLGTMISNGTALSAAWAQEWVGEWHLGVVDGIIPCNFEGVAGKRDLFMHNHDWFGMLKATPGLAMQKIFYRWIHNYRHGRNW